MAMNEPTEPQDNSLVKSYPSAEIQPAYSAVPPADWATKDSLDES